jgi:hypothetical protein
MSLFDKFKEFIRRVLTLIKPISLSDLCQSYNHCIL